MSDSEWTYVSDEQLQSFLGDLRAVYEKHGLVVHACGCCNSPFVVVADKKGPNGHEYTTTEEAISHLDKQGVL